MEIIFLGWGNAWPLNMFLRDEYTKERLKAIKEAEISNKTPKDKRYRTSLYIKSGGKISL